jgi:hypothetical protein
VEGRFGNLVSGQAVATGAVGAEVVFTVVGWLEGDFSSCGIAISDNFG